jgi:rhamnose transport system permease protein
VVLLAGGIDISLGSQMALSAGLAGWLWERGWPLGLAMPVAVGVGAVCGLVNAGLSIIGQVNPIVITLGTLSLYRGLFVWWLGEDLHIPLSRRDPLITTWLALPAMAWLGLAVAILVAVFLHRTVAGRELYAVGSNPTAAQRAGISPGRTWLVAFTLQGALAGLAGLLYLARSGSLQAVSYEDMTLQAIAAAVVGGVALTGGRGSVLGVMLGCLFLVSLPQACQHLHIPTTSQRTLVGAVMVVAVTVDALWRRRQA